MFVSPAPLRGRFYFTIMALNKNPNIIPVTGTNTTLPASSSDLDIYAGLLGDVQGYANSIGNSSKYDTAKENYLNFLMTLNQREFDTKWRDNEREYTSATSQLQRLMDTGMSYSAALAALNGSGDSGSSSGLSSPVADKANSNEDINTGLNVANTLFNTIFSGLQFWQNCKLNKAQVGLLSSQTSSVDLQNRLLSRQLDAYDSADGVAATINHAIDSGNWTPEDADRATSAAMLQAAYREGVITDSQLSAIHSSTASRMAFDDLFNSNWSTQGVKTDGALYYETRDAMFASAQVQKMMPQVTQQTLDNMAQTYTNLVAEYQNISADTENIKSDTIYKKALSVGQQIENTINKPTAQAYRQYASKVTQYGKYMISYKCAEWAAMAGNKDLLQKRINNDFQTGAISSEVARQWITFDKWCTDAAEGKFGTLSDAELAEVSLYLHQLQPYVQDNLRKIKTDQGLKIPFLYDDKVDEEFNIFTFGQDDKDKHIHDGVKREYERKSFFSK